MKPIFALALLALPAFADFPNGYTYCKVVTTSVSMVSGTSDLTNYPLTVILTDADLRTTANGGLVNNSSGYDIGFYPDCSGSGTALKWEMESYSSTTGAIAAHVLRPALSHTANDTIGMYYGGSFSSFQSTASAVWDANYMGVWHLPNGTSLISPSPDSTSNGNNGAPINGGVADSGKIGGGALFSGTYASIAVGAPATLQITGDMTISGWIKGDGTVWGTVFSGLGMGGGYPGYSLIIGTQGTCSGSCLLWYTSNDPSGTRIGATTVNGGAWFHVVAEVSGTTKLLFVNGVNDGTFTGAGGAGATGVQHYIGYSGYPIAFSGTLDEIRISNVARSADWILTEYRNQSAPGTYISAGSRLPLTGTPTPVRHHVIGGV